MEIALLLTGLAAGVVQGVFGVGAATIMVAALLMTFQFAPVEAVGTALAALAAMRLVMALVSGAGKTADRRLVVQLGGAGAAGALLGGLLSARVLAGGWPDPDDLALRAMGAALCLIGAYLVFWPDPAGDDAGQHARAAQGRPVPVPVACALGSGVIAGLSGLWSGMGISLLLLFDRERVAGDFRATLLLASAATAGAGAVAHLLLGNVHVPVAMNLLLGALPGVVAGSGLAAAFGLTGLARAGQTAADE
jgi:uncharacterized membrane protein YfcA